EELMPKLQRQEEEEEEELQAKPILQRQEEEEEEELQTKPILQRQEEEEEKLQTKSLLQRANIEAVPQVNSEMEGMINAVRGSGEPLDDSIRGPMEQTLDSDFGGVRVHKDSGADTLSQSIQARAFTTGQDIFFKNGEYNPASPAGKQLLAHELTHTIQQMGKRALNRTSNQMVSSMNRQTASRVAVKQPPPIPTSKPWKKQAPSVPNKTGRPPLPAPDSSGETYESQPLQGMDPLTYDQAIAQFQQWKKPRWRGGLSKSKRKAEAGKYLAETVKSSRKYTSYIPMIINSILEAYKETFGTDLSTIDAMKSLQQAGGGVKPETAKENIEGFDKEKAKEQEVGITKETIGTGFSWGEKGSSATRSGIEVFAPWEHTTDKDTGKPKVNFYSKQDKGKMGMGIASGATDIFSALGGGISSIFGFVKTAQLFKKQKGSAAFFGKLFESFGSLAGAVAKGAKGVVGVVKSAVKAGTGSALDVVKKVLGPIPAAISTIFSFVKIILAASKKKTKEALEAAWATAKSGVNAIMGTVSMVFGLISTMGDAVPIVGSIAKGIAAILNGIEAGYMFVKKIIKFISMKRLVDRIIKKIKELLARPAETEAEKADKKSKKDRLVYIGKNNLKKIKGVGREVLKHGISLVGNGIKLAGAVASLIGEIIAMSGVGAPVGAVFKAFGLVGSILSTVASAIAGAITFVPKLFHSIRQLGRNAAAKEGGIGKFFRFLGFNPEKSSAKKEEERKKVVIGIFNDAAKLKTDFDDPSGKDREKVKAELPKYKDLEFEIEATGADKDELYKHNAEGSDANGAKAQVKIIYDALKER
ncbi:DUF4157 domain-containing protein, partial [Chloroflexota bacterium]